MTTKTHAPLTLESMRADIARLLGEAPDAFENNDNLLDWGLDSMRVFSLVVEWQQAGVELSFADLAENPTLADWWQIVQRQQSEL